MKRLLSFALAIIFAMQLWAQSTVVIVGDSTLTTQAKYVPANTYYKNSYTQSLYPASEIQPGMITSISYYHTAQAYNVGTVSIYMKEVTDATLSTTYSPTEGFVEVYTGSLNLVNGWVTYQLTSPFVYTGGGNLLVCFVRNATDYEDGHNFKYAGGVGSSIYKQSDSEVYTLTNPPATGTQISYVPVTKFEMEELGEDFCYPPLNMAIDNSTLSSTEATITWSSDATNFTVQCKLQSEDWDSENVQEFTATDTSFTLTELSAATFYTVRVKALCSNGDESVWSTINFRSACEIVTEFPWIETFESTWIAGDISGTIVAPLCWININGDNSSTYKINTTTSGYEGSGVYMYGYTTSTSTSTSYVNKDWFISPVVELTGEEMLSFYTKKSSSSYAPQLRIYALNIEENGDMTSVADTANFVLIDSITDLPTTYAEMEVLLSDFEGQYRLAFVRNRTIGHGSVYIDNVKVSGIPSCSRVSGLATTEVSTNQATITWEEPEEGANSYNIYFKPANLLEWTVISDVTDLTYTFTDLTPATQYHVNVTAVCDNGIETGFVTTGNLSIITPCETYEVPFFEDFTTYPAGSVTSCWLEAKGQWDSIQAGATVWGYSNLWGSYSSNVFDAHAKIENYSNNRKDWLITPNVNIGDGSIEYDLVFDIAYTDYSNANPVESYAQQRFAVIVSTDGGLTWDFENAVIWKVNPAEETNERNIEELTNTPQRLKFNLTELGYTGVIRVGFYAESLISGADNDIHIDNVQIAEHVDCNDMVVAPSVNPSSATSVAVSWNAEEHESANGWNISYVEGETNDDPENGTIVNVAYGSDMPYVIEGLTAGQTYSFAIQYDCGGGWSNGATMTLPESADMFATIPYYQNFEDLDENANWTITNNSYVNRWFIGDPANVAEEGNMLYVSNDSLGVNSIYSNAYATPSVASYVFASRLLQFDESLAYEISFDFKAQGESTYDFIKVALRPWNESYTGITGAPTWTGADAVQEGFDYAVSGPKFNLDTTGTRGVIIVDGSVVNNSLQQLVFAWRNDGSGGVASAVTVDNISVEPINCIAPDGFSLAEDGRQLTSLTFDVDTRSGDTWEIQYQEYSDTVWQSVFSTDTEGIEVSNLLPGTMYRFKVRSICDEDSSYFTDEVLYSTACPVITVTDEASFTEGFEYSNWFRSGNVTSPNAYAPMCWFNVDAGSTSYRWQNSSTEPYEGTYSAQLYTYGGSADWLITPIIEIAGTETMSFFAKYTSTTASSTLHVKYYSVDENGDMSSAADTALFVELQGIELSDEYEPYDISFNGLSAGQYRFAFYSNHPTASYYVRLDDVSISNISCARPVSIDSVASITDNSAIVYWTDEVNSEWTIYYRAEGAEEYQVATSTTTSVELTDLDSHTDYEFYIVSNCGAEVSEPTIVETFQTACSYITELPFMEGFENTFITEGLSNAAAPVCWINLNGGYTTSYSTYAFQRSTTSSYVYEGAAALYSYGSSNVQGNDDWLITPVFSNEGGIVMRLFAKISSATSAHPNIMIKYYDVETYGDVNEIADSANFVTLGTITATTTYAEYEYIFENLPSTYRLAFVRQDATGCSMYIDNLYIGEIPTCLRPDPASVQISDITQTTATVSWTDSDETHSAWNVYYKSSTDEEYLSEYSTETTIELADLTSSEEYEVYVTAICEGNDESDATYIERFTTLQYPVELPYTCDFEEEGSNGWLVKNSTNTNQWHVGTPSGATSGELYISSDNGATAGYAHSAGVVVAEKLFQLGITDSVRISFDITIGGEGSSDYLKVYWVAADTNYNASAGSTYPYYATTGYSNNIIMNNYTGTYGYHFVNLVSGTQNMSVTLENSPNELRKLVFVWKNDGSLGTQPGAIIDNIMIEPVGEEITCTKPVANSVVASSITSTSAVISWTDVDETHSAWNLYYKTEAEEEYSVISASETTIELTTLDPATVYSVYVTTDCGGGDESAPTDTIVFMTECLTVDEFPYNEGFNSTAIPCWSTVPVNQTYNWAIAATYQGGVTPAEGEAFVIFKNSSRGSSARLTSPIFDLTSLTNPTLDFMYIAKLWSSDLDELKVQYRTSAEEEWVDLVHYNAEETAWSQKTIALPNPSATYQIAFLGISNYGYGAAIDNVVVYDAEEGGEDPEPEPCDAPTALSASNITETSADITWNGTASTYEFKLNGGTAETLTTTIKALTGLTANTDYTVEVRAVCEDQTSDWVITTFTTLEEVVTPEPCDAPTNLSASNITETTADITWNGTASTYEFKLNGGTAETLTTTTKALTGLTANTAYIVEVRAVCEDAESDWVTTTFTTLEEVPEIVAPVVTTTEATSVTHESAVLNGTITAGSEEITAQGFRYKTATASEWIEVSATGTTISATVNNLTAETAYVFKAFATTASGTVEGTEMTFTTIAAPIVVVEGEVTTTPATNIANTSATLNGVLVSAGNSENYTIGFALATVADFTLEDAGVQNITATLNGSTFTATVNDLVEGQTYFYRAYITNEAGTAYGTVETFTLLGLTDALANQIAVQLYPNPASDNATLDINGLNQDAKIVISDLQGRILSQEAISAGETRYTINVSNMASGVYYIRIVTDKAVSTQKLIVE